MNSVRDEPRRSASVGSHHESGVELLSENAVPSPIILNRIAQDEPKSYTPSARKVYVRSTILSIIEINSAEQFFRAEVVLEFSFSHPEIEAFTEADLERDGFAQMNKIFESRFLNLIEEDHSEKWIRKDKKDDPCHVRIMHRFKGKFTERFELEKFPFDKQELTIRITASQPTTLFEFKINQEKPSIVMDDNQSAFILAEWTLVPGIVMKESRSKAKTSATGVLYPHMYISTYVKRNSMHFIYNYFVVLFLLTTLSGSAYSIPIDEPADRISVEVTLLLAVVAFKYVVSQNIPRVPYNTILDLYILSSFFFLSIVTIEVAVAGGTDFGQYDRPFALILGFVWIAMNLLFIYRAFDAVVMREIRAQPFIDAKIHNEQQDEKDEQDIVNPHHNPYLSFAEKVRVFFSGNLLRRG